MQCVIFYDVEALGRLGSVSSRRVKVNNVLSTFNYMGFYLFTGLPEKKIVFGVLNSVTVRLGFPLHTERR